MKLRFGRQFYVVLDRLRRGPALAAQEATSTGRSAGLAQ